MDTLLGLLVMGTSVWVFFDARKLAKKLAGQPVQADKPKAKIRPVLWAIGTLFFSFVVLPVYLAKRPKYKGGKIGAVECVGFGITAIIVGCAIMESSSSIPKTIEIKSDSIIFSDWNAVHDFNKALGDFTKASISPSDPAPTDFSKKILTEIETLKITFKAKGKVLDVPVGTKIDIAKYCDQNGNEIEPIWKDRAKAFFTPDGDSVYVTGEWQGKSVISMLVTYTSN